MLRGALEGSVTVAEHGLQYAVDPLGGQKTGWFIDQRDHRLALRPWARDVRALDLCCYDGGFSLNALAGGARHVTAVDVSAGALERAVANAARNGLEGRLSTVEADVFDLVGGAPPASTGIPTPARPMGWWWWIHRT